jgi:hypothetical protein
MTLTTSSSPARRSLLGLVVALALAVVFFAAASPAEASTTGPIGKLDNAGGQISSGVVSGWADHSGYASAINVRLDVYRGYWECLPGLWGCRWELLDTVLVDSRMQIANEWNSDAAFELFDLYGSFDGYHGFEFNLRYQAGDKACVTAIDGRGLGSDTSLGCVTLAWPT